ncbi:MAG: TlpA disulfide reductase family protein [Weeksellaceae bacterium]|nr:TlpA disulfide reductase family protein [Weeksellaceae bacterium]
MKFLKKHGSTILLGLFLLLFLIPQTRKPIQVQIQRLIAMPPSQSAGSSSGRSVDMHWTIENVQQQPVNLSQSVNKVTLINFWATWCPPCIAEMPDFQKLYAQYGDRVDFYFISQEDWTAIQQFEDKRTYGLPYYRALQPHSDLSAQSLPTTYLIGKDGKVIMRKVGIAKWNSQSMHQIIDQALAQP